MHAKGMDQSMIDVGAGHRHARQGLAQVLGASTWACRTTRRTSANWRSRTARTATGLMALSTGSRSFTRYGYADLLREDRRYGVLHRIWPGTQRLLLWGDPVTAAAYSRAFSFCGSEGVEIFEPLSFKGRRGSGIAGRPLRATPMRRLKPRWDWEKYLYTLPGVGPAAVQPEADPDGLAPLHAQRVRRRRRRGSRARQRQPHPAHRHHGARALRPPTTITGPRCTPTSRSWTRRKPHPYSDTASPKVFGNVSPLDPQLFSRIERFRRRAVEGGTQRQVFAGRSGAVDRGPGRRPRPAS